MLVYKQFEMVSGIFILRPELPMHMSNKIIRYFACPVVAALIFSCESPGETPTISADAEKAVIEAAEAATAAQDSTVNLVAIEPPVEAGFTNYPDATEFPAHILNTTQYHGDEVTGEDVNRIWYGVFRGKKGFYLDSTGFRTKRVEDMNDENGQKTGWEISTTNSDTAVVLIAGVDNLTKHPIDPVNMPEEGLKPGDTVAFSYGGKNYALYATGDIRKTVGEGKLVYNGLVNYRLFLKVNGIEQPQLLVAEKDLQETEIRILFAGDIDGDGAPDFLIETSNHYNV